MLILFCYIIIRIDKYGNYDIIIYVNFISLSYLYNYGKIKYYLFYILGYGYIILSL